MDDSVDMIVDNLDSNRIVIGRTYLIIVIFFTLTQFLENKIYAEIYTVNC